MHIVLSRWRPTKKLGYEPPITIRANSFLFLFLSSFFARHVDSLLIPQFKLTFQRNVYIYIYYNAHLCAHFISFVEKSFSLSLDSHYRPESWTNKSDELFEKLYHTSTTVCSRERSVSIIAYQLERTNINERRSNAAGASVRSRKRTGIREVFDEGSRSVLLKLGGGDGRLCEREREGKEEKRRRKRKQEVDWISPRPRVYPLPLLRIHTWVLPIVCAEGVQGCIGALVFRDGEGRNSRACACILESSRRHTYAGHFRCDGVINGNWIEPPSTPLPKVIARLKSIGQRYNLVDTVRKFNYALTKIRARRYSTSGEQVVGGGEGTGG